MKRHLDGTFRICFCARYTFFSWWKENNKQSLFWKMKHKVLSEVTQNNSMKYEKVGHSPYNPKNSEVTWSTRWQHVFVANFSAPLVRKFQWIIMFIHFLLAVGPARRLLTRKYCPARRLFTTIGLNLKTNGYLMEIIKRRLSFNSATDHLQEIAQ